MDPSSDPKCLHFVTYQFQLYARKYDFAMTVLPDTYGTDECFEKHHFRAHPFCLLAQTFRFKI